jgi:GntR family transcriptional regulator
MTCVAGRSPVSKLTHARINKDTAIPYYFQLKESLKSLVDEGTLREGDQIPSEQDLCQEFDVSRTVVRQALNELVNEGLLVRHKGKGTFVARPKILANLMQSLTGFYKDMAGRDLQTTSKVLEQSVIAAGRWLAGLLELTPGERVIRIDRLRYVSGEPITHVRAHIPEHFCPDLVHEDLAGQSLYAVMESRFGLTIVRSRRTIEAVGASERMADLLGIDAGAPLLLLKSVSYLEDGRPVEHYEALHRGDRSGFRVELVRGPHQGLSLHELFTGMDP